MPGEGGTPPAALFLGWPHTLLCHHLVGHLPLWPFASSSGENKGKAVCNQAAKEEEVERMACIFPVSQWAFAQLVKPSRTSAKCCSLFGFYYSGRVMYTLMVLKGEKNKQPNTPQIIWHSCSAFQRASSTRLQQSLKPHFKVDQYDHIADLRRLREQWLPRIA